MSDDFVSQLNVWCCLSQALRQSAAALAFSHCAVLSSMRRKWHAGNAILVAFFTRCRTSNFFLFAYVSTPHLKMILEVFKSTLLSPSNDTRRCTTHASEPRHAAKIQLSCRPCVYVHILKESAEVRNTVLRRDSHKDHESDAKSKRGSMPWPYPCVRVCQEPLPPWTEQHHPRSPPNNLTRTKRERKTDEDQLLLLRAPMFRQRKKRIKFRSTCVDRYALRALAHARAAAWRMLAL